LLADGIMAYRVSKRKLPLREDKQLNEINKIAGKVFDRMTLAVLVRMLNAGIFRSLDYPIASGKEAIVFRATTKTGYAAVKVYKYETSSFHHMLPYIEGDPRFKAVRRKRDLVQLWARKEFANLQACASAGVSAPEPVAMRDNVVVMEFLGEKGVPYALLEDVVVEKPAAVCDAILKDVKKLYRDADLVHADLSPFNVIMRKQEPVIIDWGQAVLAEHPKAEEFLRSDVTNIVKYFARLGVKREPEAILEGIAHG